MRWLAVSALALAACRGGDPPAARPARTDVTFAHDIAPIVWTKCAPCHRPGQPGPFSLLSYKDVAGRAKQIAKVTASRYMPPWKPVGAAVFTSDRSLSADQIALIGRWVGSGAPEGDPAETPPLPAWPDGWLLGKPDLVVTMPQPYTVPADGRDVYRNFVLPTGMVGSHWIAAYEFHTGGTKAIHHAIVNVDRRGWARRKDAEDPEPGYPGMDSGDIQAPDGFYLVWTPGKPPVPPQPGWAWRLDETADLVLQLHLQPSGRPQVVQPSIGLYFADGPPTRQRITLKIGDPEMDIAAGSADYVIRDAVTLPADTDLLGLFPHAHYLGKKMRVWASEPGGAHVDLLAIDDWDFNWQEEYTYAEPQHLPAGTVVHMEFHYDNSAANTRNPSDPPVRVTSGERTVDEMGNVTLELSPRDPRDMEKLREAKYRGLLARAPHDARTRFNLGNTLSRQGRIDDAITAYKQAMADDPKLAPAAFNLGNLLQQQGKVADAIAAFQAALAAEPTFAEAELNLGNALAATGDRAGAALHIGKALALRPGYPEAMNAQRMLGSGSAAGGP